MEHSGTTSSPQGGCSWWQSRQVTAVWCFPPFAAIAAGSSRWHLEQSAVSRATSAAPAPWTKAVNNADVKITAQNNTNCRYAFFPIILITPFSCKKLTYHMNILPKMNEWSFIIRLGPLLSSVNNFCRNIMSRQSMLTSTMTE